MDAASYAINNNGFATFEQQSYGCPSIQDIPPGYENSTDQLAYSSNAYCHMDTAYDLPSPMISETKVRTDPVVTGFNPEEGRERTRVIIHIRSNHPLVDAAIARASLSFAGRNCLAQFISLGFSSGYLYAVTSEVPIFAATGSSSPHVFMCVHLQNESGASVYSMDVGYFRYTSQNEAGLASTSTMSKEQVSDASATGSLIANQAVNQQLPRSYSSGHVPVATNPYTYRIRPHNQDCSPRYSPYDLRQTSFRRRSSTLSSETTNSSLPCTPRDLGWSSNYTAINCLERKTASSLTPSPRFSYIPKTTIVSSPTLIRITQLVKVVKVKQGLGLITPSGDGSLGSHSENQIYPTARLDIDGQLQSMTENWTLQESMNKRRLVEFRRSQTGGVVSTSFTPVETCARKRSTISCILWERKKGQRQYVITSVDIIHLLEFLIDCQTDTDEKNRIRRNVERFDARTTYKDDSETGGLFNVIMGLPEPKPRRIAKPVKVFPWISLATAVAKVIEKFTPDYYDAAVFIRDHPELFKPQKSVKGPTSQPNNLLKSETKEEDEDDVESNGSSHSTPNSTSKSLHSRSPSSAYTPSVGSCPSSTLSPNMEHTFHNPQSLGTMAPYPIGASSALHYASAQSTFPRPEALGSNHKAYISMVAGQPVRGSWDFSGVGFSNHATNAG
ncbi:MAG: hypothetical protein Q9180_004209 [Flavoplaca navasiana]